MIWSSSNEVSSEESWCNSDWKSWLKKQRNVLTLCHHERALWNATIKSPIVTLNVKLIGQTLWAKLPSSFEQSQLVTHVGLYPSYTLILFRRKPHKQHGPILKLAWRRRLCSFHAKSPYMKKEDSLKGAFHAKKQSWQARGETLERLETSRHVKNVNLNVLMWSNSIRNFFCG